VGNFDIDESFLKIIKILIGFAVVHAGVKITDAIGDEFQAGGREFGSSLGTVTPDSTLIHKAVALIDILAGNDVRFFESSILQLTGYFNIGKLARQCLDLSQNRLQGRIKNAKTEYIFPNRLNFQPVRSDQTFFG